MFIDYYTVLNINKTSSQNEIRLAFKKEALLWHPDKNKTRDTTLKMQQINEAYLILKDQKTKSLYDKEHNLFYQQNKTTQNTYDVKDDILNNKMKDAQKESVDLAKKPLEEMLEITKIGLIAFGQAMVLQLINSIGCLFWFLIFAIISYFIN